MNLRLDVTHALRMMRKNPGLTLATVLTLALGIGASTAIFTVIHAVLLKPLSYPDPDRLVRISGGATFARYDALRGARSFSGVGAFLGITDNVTLAGVEGPEPLKGARVSPEFLTVLGEIGRASCRE